MIVLHLSEAEGSDSGTLGGPIASLPYAVTSAMAIILFVPGEMIVDASPLVSGEHVSCKGPELPGKSKVTTDPSSSSEHATTSGGSLPLHESTDWHRTIPRLADGLPAELPTHTSNGSRRSRAQLSPLSARGWMATDEMVEVACSSTESHGLLSKVERQKFHSVSLPTLESMQLVAVKLRWGRLVFRKVELMVALRAGMARGGRSGGEIGGEMGGAAGGLLPSAAVISSGQGHQAS